MEKPDQSFAKWSQAIVIADQRTGRQTFLYPRSTFIQAAPTRRLPGNEGRVYRQIGEAGS
ncbi:MAG: hypothetical protein ABJH04_18750 [Cyclobacteriaceae bacterium]